MANIECIKNIENIENIENTTLIIRDIGSLSLDLGLKEKKIREEGREADHMRNINIEVINIDAKVN